MTSGKTTTSNAVSEAKPGKIRIGYQAVPNGEIIVKQKKTARIITRVFALLTKKPAIQTGRTKGCNDGNQSERASRRPGHGRARE